MAIRNVITFEEHTSITTQSDDCLINPSKEVTAAALLTAGTPTTGAMLQITLDDIEKIKAGTALWVNSPLGNRITSGAEKLLRPVTGVRLKVTDGTWTLQVRQQ
jgi:hypothetical protein